MKQTFAFFLLLAALSAHAAEQTSAAVSAKSEQKGKPLVTLVSRAPESPSSGDAVVVTARASGIEDIVGVKVACSSPGQGTGAVLQAFDDGVSPDAAARDGVYTAVVSARPGGRSMEYRFIATNLKGEEFASDQASYVVQATPRPEFRVMQVDSWSSGILTKAQVDELVATCRAANLNVIMPEVRKVGDADYESQIEPRANNIEDGFDPLAYLIQLAHDTSGGKQHIAVHGWFVMHRIAKAEKLSPRHVLSRHPEYEMLKADGSRNEGNRYLDPGHPGAVDHNIAVILDCIRCYDVEGINCDYIRYPEDPGGWGYNSVSVARFNDVFKKTGTPAQDDPDWQAWRRECVSLELKKLYVKAWQVKPGVLLTCDTINWGDGYKGYKKSAPYIKAFQDWKR